jgi:hypothetical protein
VRIRPRVNAILKKISLHEIDGSDARVTALIAQYREKWELGAYNGDPRSETRWWAAMHAERIVAVAAERQPFAGCVEVLAAYCESSRYGVIAAYVLANGFKVLLDTGKIDVLRETVLYANVRMWKAIIRETKTKPWALIFEHRRPPHG